MSAHRDISQENYRTQRNRKPEVIIPDPDVVSDPLINRIAIAYANEKFDGDRGRHPLRVRISVKKDSTFEIPVGNVFQKFITPRLTKTIATDQSEIFGEYTIVPKNYLATQSQIATLIGYPFVMNPTYLDRAQQIEW